MIQTNFAECADVLTHSGRFDEIFNEYLYIYTWPTQPAHITYSSHDYVIEREIE